MSNPPRGDQKRLRFRKPIGFQSLDRGAQVRGQFLKIVRFESGRVAEILVASDESLRLGQTGLDFP